VGDWGWSMPILAALLMRGSGADMKCQSGQKNVGITPPDTQLHASDWQTAPLPSLSLTHNPQTDRLPVVPYHAGLSSIGVATQE
jgi:hypothetical protein